MLPIRYWNRIANIGDSINPHILELVSQDKSYYSTNEAEEHVLGIGSIFFMANKQSHIWGSGMLDPKRDYSAIDLEKVHAVRGALTASILREKYGLSRSIALGDPGIFADEIPQVGEALRRNEIKRKAVVIPHYAMTSNEKIVRLAADLDAAILSPRTSSLDFLTELAAAEIVVSQSLHGLIFAEVFGKRSTWIAHTDDEGWTFKFHDWFSNTIDPPRRPLPLDAAAGRVLSDARLSGLNVDRRALREALPRLAGKAREGGVDFRECRERSPIVLFVSADKQNAEASNNGAILYCETGNDEMLRRSLNEYGRRFDEPCSLLLVFENDALSPTATAKLRDRVDLLTEFPDIHYCGFLPAHNGETAEPGRVKAVRDGVSFHEWNPKYNWRGAMLVRHPVNFSFAAPGYAEFATL
jgi:hypothetical protein